VSAVASKDETVMAVEHEFLYKITKVKVVVKLYKVNFWYADPSVIKLFPTTVPAIDELTFKKKYLFSTGKYKEALAGV